MGTLIGELHYTVDGLIVAALATLVLLGWRDAPPDTEPDPFAEG